MATDKRRVTMTTYSTRVVGADVQLEKHEAIDFVPAAILDSYVADAQTKWQQVIVSAEFDSGPGGDAGETTIPTDLQGA